MLVPHLGEGFQNQISVEKLMQQAKARRSQYLKENSRRLFPVIGWAAAVLSLAFILTFATRPAHQHVLDVTAHMERLAAALAAGKAIKPDTAGEISRLLRASEYSCIDLACDAPLERRNRDARSKLRALLTQAARPEVIATDGTPAIVQSQEPNTRSSETTRIRR
jgi:hypothetical protein